MKKPGDESENISNSDISGILKGKIIETLKTCYDPEIPVNIYELGLVYDIVFDTPLDARIVMTLTSPACPVAGSMPGEIEEKLRGIPELHSAKVELTWEPPWTPEKMTEAARLQLNM